MTERQLKLAFGRGVLAIIAAFFCNHFAISALQHDHPWLAVPLFAGYILGWIDWCECVTKMKRNRKRSKANTDAITNKVAGMTVASGMNWNITVSSRQFIVPSWNLACGPLSGSFSGDIHHWEHVVAQLDAATKEHWDINELQPRILIGQVVSGEK